jgi:hypothetical protein
MHYGKVALYSSQRYMKRVELPVTLNSGIRCSWLASRPRPICPLRTCHEYPMISWMDDPSDGLDQRFPKVFSADPKGYAISSQGTRCYVSVMSNLKLASLFRLKEWFGKNNRWTSLICDFYLFRTTVRISNYETPCTHEASDSLINVISYNALLRLLLICIGGYLKSVLRYKFVILDTSHTDNLHLRQQWCEDPWLYFEVKRVSASKNVWETHI